MMMNDGERWVMTEKRFLNDDDNTAASAGVTMTDGCWHFLATADD